MSAGNAAAPAGPVPDLRVIERFLYHEARLLDERRWDEWEALWTPEGEYWMPASENQPDPLNHVSLVYERSLLRKVRLKRYAHPNAFSLVPAPRTMHMVSNVMLDGVDAASGECVVTSRFIVLQYRRDKQDVYGGCCTHRLVPHGDSFRMALKKVEIVNCDAALENILVYL